MAHDHDTAPAARQRRPRIADIAARTGLSTATVSRALNGKPWVSESTRTQVLAVLDEVGYVPSRLAASLRTGRTGLLGLVIGEPRGPTELAAIQGAWAAAAPARYSVVVYIPPAGGQQESASAAILAPGWVDGVLLLYAKRSDEPLIRRLQHNGLPLVLIDPEVKVPDVPTVYPDYYNDGYQMTRYLVGCGHRRIGLCASDIGWGYDARYIDGYHAALVEAQVPLDPVLAIAEGASYEVGYETTRRWLRLADPPTGLCFHSDMSAMGAIVAAREMGRHVPNDVSIMGFDDTQMARWMKPALTTPRERLLGLTRAATALLLDLIRGTAAAGEPLFIQTDLVVRESTGRAPAPHNLQNTTIR